MLLSDDPALPHGITDLAALSFTAMFACLSAYDDGLHASYGLMSPEIDFVKSMIRPTLK
jgi:hypothetical protein